MKFDTIIKGGTVVTAADTFLADIGILDGRITALAGDLDDAGEIIDATGLLVMPGGIDSHVHLEQPGSPGIVMADTFETDPTPQVIGQELPALIAEGFTSIKIFMTYDDMKLADREILEVLDVAREHKALVMVHAEGYDSIRFLSDRLERQGKTSPIYHGASRPVAVEREATHRAISLAEIVETPVMIVHVSNRQAMEEIRRAQMRGLPVYGETCPQYLVLTEADMDRAGMEGAKYVCSPPPRDLDSQAACWEGLQQGVFEVFSSDHCPYRYDDEAGKLAPKGKTNFRYVPNGIPGIATRMPILFSEGVVKGRIDLNRFVALTSTNHAKRYGLYPQKGTIAVGADADIVLWDAAREVTIRHEILQDGCDYTPYEGLEATGWPVLTMLRGNVVVKDNELTRAVSGNILSRR